MFVISAGRRKSFAVSEENTPNFQSSLDVVWCNFRTICFSHTAWRCFSCRHTKCSNGLFSSCPDGRAVQGIVQSSLVSQPTTVVWRLTWAENVVVIRLEQSQWDTRKRIKDVNVCTCNVRGSSLKRRLSLYSYTLYDTHNDRVTDKTNTILTCKTHVRLRYLRRSL